LQDHGLNPFATNGAFHLASCIVLFELLSLVMHLQTFAQSEQTLGDASFIEVQFERYQR
jgi:hypothetical protein